MYKYLLKTALLLPVILLLVTGVFAQPGNHYEKMQPRRPGGSNAQRPSSPGNNAVWVNEEWKWNNGRYAWGGGYWARPPFRGAVWVPGRWVHSRFGWQWVPGKWTGRSGHLPNRPRH